MKVKVVGVAGESVTVEYRGDYKGAELQRSVVPREAVSGDTVSDEVLAAGIPYGIPWEEITPEMRDAGMTVARALRQYGFWTVKDLQDRPAEAVATIQRALGVYLAALVKAATSYGGMK